MSGHEHAALDALRSVDGPVELGDGVEERIEAEMLARFDEIAGSAATHEPPTVVALESARDRVAGRSTSRMARATAKVIAAAAALVALVAGLAVVLDREEPASVGPTVTTIETSDEAARLEVIVAQQLSAFCTDFLVPAREAVDFWTPEGFGSEARGNVIIGVERAAEAMSNLDPPLGDRFDDLAGQLVDAATEARLVTSLNRADGDESVIAAVELLETAPDVSGVSPLPEACLP